MERISGRDRSDAPSDRQFSNPLVLETHQVKGVFARTNESLPGEVVGEGCMVVRLPDFLSGGGTSDRPRKAEDGGRAADLPDEALVASREV